MLSAASAVASSSLPYTTVRAGRAALAALLAAAFCAGILSMPVAALGVPAFTITEAAPGMFVHSGRQLAVDAPGHDDIANIGFVVGKRCVAVIDTGGSVRIGRRLRSAIAQRTPLPVCYVINTHVHVDHVLGNAAFRDSAAKFVGHELLGDALIRSRDVFLKDYAADLDAPPSAAQIIGPQLSVAVGSDLELDLGDRRLTLHAWPKAHTDCDLSVYDRVSGTLWSGDLLFVERTPALDGSLKGWLSAIDVLAGMHVMRVVPGHGPVRADLPAALAPERRYLEELLTDVRAQIARGNPMQSAIREVNPPEKTTWLLWDATHPRNVARAYQELEWE
jgi:quinoprotein relay system zinc metallohydrolase 2